MYGTQAYRRHHRGRAPSRLIQAGYSLYDLLVTSAIASALGLGAVGMTGLVQDTQMTAQVNQMMGYLHLARSEAIRRHKTVVLCKSSNGTSCSTQASWNEGWIIFADDNNNHDADPDETVIRVQQKLEGNLNLRYGNTGTYSYVRYNPSGEAWPGATFTFCDHRGANKAKAVIVYWTGRPRVSARTSANAPLSCS